MRQNVLPDMLFRWLFIASNPIRKLIGNSCWYIKWLGTVDRPFPAWQMADDLRSPPPHPSRAERDRGMRMVVTVSLVYLPPWAGGQTIPKN
jgi:hypothetical protein